MLLFVLFREFRSSDLFSLKFVYIFFGGYSEIENTLLFKVVFNGFKLAFFFFILNKKSTHKISINL